MTGFGKTTGEINGKKLTIEIKSLNSKQADISIRMPSIYKAKELPLRSLINKSLVRGKVDFSLYVEMPQEESKYTINKELFKTYYEDLTTVARELNDGNNTDFISIITKLPDVLKSERAEFDESEWSEIEPFILQAIDDLNDFRSSEGKSLHTELTTRVENIQTLLLEVDPFELQRIETVKTRIKGHLNESVGDNFNKDRFEQELIYYLEKFDITEEKTRLTTHCNYFIETMAAGDSEGKKLGFIGQEMGREINTLGSKANHADIQKIVVQMKDELEKMKEQILNIL